MERKDMAPRLPWRDVASGPPCASPRVPPVPPDGPDRSRLSPSRPGKLGASRPRSAETERGGGEPAGRARHRQGPPAL